MHPASVLLITLLSLASAAPVPTVDNAKAIYFGQPSLDGVVPDVVRSVAAYTVSADEKRDDQVPDEPVAAGQPMQGDTSDGDGDDNDGGNGDDGNDNDDDDGDGN